MLYTKGSVEQPEPVKWWTELSHVDGAPHPHLGSGAESPRSSTVDLTARSAARQALFSKATFPLVLDTIVSHAAHADRLSLRLVCRRVAAHTDAALFRTLTVTTHGFRSADGTLPLVNLWRRPDVAGAVRSLTITDEWDDWTALAHVFPGLAPDVIRVPASCPLDILGLQASTVIAFGDVVSATTSDWLRVHSLPRFFYAVVRHARRHHRWNGRYAERAVADAIRFVSEDEYRSEIGEVVWRLETELEA